MIKTVNMSTHRDMTDALHYSANKMSYCSLKLLRVENFDSLAKDRFFFSLSSCVFPAICILKYCGRPRSIIDAFHLQPAISYAARTVQIASFQPVGYAMTL